MPHVPVLTIAFMVVTLLICFVLPVAAFAWLATRRDRAGGRRYEGLWRPFWAGALAFVASQVLTRLPLMTFVVPHLPQPLPDILLSGPVASYTAGLFEETGRLLVMLWLLKRCHRFVDGLTFGLGHGGIEAALLVGLSTVSNLGLALAVDSGGWQQVADRLPPETARTLLEALTTVSPWTYLAGGVERIGAIILHITCSCLVLWGVHSHRKALYWIIAVLVHGTTNLTVVMILGFTQQVWLGELALAVIAVGMIVFLRRFSARFPNRRGTDNEGSSTAGGPVVAAR